MFLEGKEYILSPSKPFLFNPEKMEFIVDRSLQRLDDLEDIYQLDNTPLKEGKTDFAEGIPLLLGPWFTIIQMPSLRQWILDLKSGEDSVRQDVIKIMAKVVRRSKPQFKIPNIKDDGYFVNFSASFGPYGRFRLQTFGNCACLGNDPIGAFVTYKDGYTANENLAVPLSYKLHNDETPVQRLSLYAGAGTLAWILLEQHK